tara:strand:+ start:1030 stop:3291 length:2262 start_codon:yes stop_codon:yes gene_type:complete
MGKYYIYNAKLEDKKHKNATIVFNPDINFDFNTLKNELTEYFRYFHQTSILVFLYCKGNKDVQKSVEANLEAIFKSIPKVEESSLSDNISYIPYDRDSFSFPKRGFFAKNKKEILNQGLVKIFEDNGGLVESNGISHHFVFPSGKHSSKFLRTANVLVFKSQIDFIAINTLHLFSKLDFDNIYCDTLSINVIAYSITKYLKRYNQNKEINIESFKSYDGLYNSQSTFYDKSIFLISASTSGGLINYIQKNHPEIGSDEICTLYYMPIDKDSPIIQERVLCNLERNEKLNYGIPLYDQSKPNEKCAYCVNHSTPISIIGDSFNLDEPVIYPRNISASKYISKSLKNFVEVFKLNKESGTSLKVSYSEDSTSRKKYNLYIDYENIISNITNESFKSHKSKLDAYINQYVPASITHIVHLNDKGSVLLSQYIKDEIKDLAKNEITIINQSDLKEDTIVSSTSGSILIVGSCISNGKNLLYLSRFFRNYENIRLIYFIGINRVSDPKKFAELRTNIKYGLYGSDNSSLVEIETINCDNSSSNTPWEQELDYLQSVQEELDVPSEFINDRIDVLRAFSDSTNRGGSEKIFYSSLGGNELEIRKNSAFFNDNNYYQNVTQSDVYFSISCVLNNMRNNIEDGLFQTSFVKNVLDPFVFNRFNDGIIQASLLRAARNEELNYSCSKKISADMLMLLKTFLKSVDEYQGEAILEFLYALAIGKLRLSKEHYNDLIIELKNHSNQEFQIFKSSIEQIYNDSLS